MLLFHPHLTYSPCPHFHHTARPHPPSLSGSPSEVSAVPRSLRRAPREQLAGCRERGSSKGARSRMLRAKECKQVEPLHYMAPPPHSHAPPPTVSFYVDVDYTHKHTNTHTHTKHCIPPPLFLKSDCVCVVFFNLAVSCAAVRPQDLQTTAPLSPGCLFSSKYFVKPSVPRLCACVKHSQCLCLCVHIRY